MNDETRAGEFYFPGGAMVKTFGVVTNGYYRNRQSQHIRLNRQEPDGTITGEFRCNIPDAMGMNVDLFINISEFTNILHIQAILNSSLETSN